jgi:2-C-methyl-D-erythritol 2,4-cyclodiphosphate synthase
LLLEQTVNLVREKGFEIANIDITVIAQKPKINPKREEMVNKIAMLLGIDKERVSVKGTTTEKMGFIGREEGMAAMATVLVFKK